MATGRPLRYICSLPGGGRGANGEECSGCLSADAAELPTGPCCKPGEPGAVPGACHHWGPPAQGGACWGRWGGDCPV